MAVFRDLQPITNRQKPIKVQARPKPPRALTAALQTA
jgi:hypothetical protein